MCSFSEVSEEFYVVICEDQRFGVVAGKLKLYINKSVENIVNPLLVPLI